ncbi:NADH:flavin oxidoreductase/NADH oxidase [Adhaeribacter swui]|uniref:NADH:flavin oxidoreductase/NADH oxidase n=1 Tax=Adhaeribacter swui TaxID=2086471 RepID=A0A7G7GEE8_9BACT|nr:NADH:flavin oxidoreductase/NADH oxidase [Adhaeribacter swui]QNF35532.1 NADH:flavin oxidoreductase/NADH oxidase [Adhaeribacter swui]
MNHLFNPLTIKSLTFKNRIVVSPMCQYSATDGFANDWHLVHLGSRAVGGAALVIAEATAVNPEGRITPHDLGLWQDEHITFLQRITAFIHQQGSLAGVQLAHAGRKASKSSPWTGNQHLSTNEGGWDNVMAPSAIALNPDTPAPQELTTEQIKQVVLDFKSAAARALKAGFKVIEIHGAHGYLLHEFVSPLTNTRTDDYGGSFENRTRIVREVVQAVQEVWPTDLPLFVRLSATDWVPDENSWRLEDSVELARQLKTLGVDLIDCSSGGNVPVQQIKPGPGYQTPFAQAIRNQAGILTGAVGLISSPLQADHIIRTEQADMVFIAREFLRDPYFGLTAASELRQPITWPVQYERAKPR